MITYDIVLDGYANLQIDSSGQDVLQGDAGNNHISYIVQSSPGHFKQSPQIGASIWQYLLSTATIVEIERQIRVQLESVGFQNPIIDVSTFYLDNTIKINKIQLTLN